MKIEIVIECERAVLESTHSRKTRIEIEGADSVDFDNETVAKCINPDTYINAYGEDELKQYIKDNYDWKIE